MELPEIADFVLTNLYLEDTFNYRQVCQGWNIVFRQSNRRPTNNDWLQIIKNDNASMFGYLVQRYPEELLVAIQTLYQCQHESSKIYTYLAMNHPDELLSQAEKYCWNFTRLMNRYPIVRELFVGSLLMFYLYKGSYDRLELLFVNAEEQELMSFFKYLVLISYTETNLLDILYNRIIWMHPGLMLTIHHSGGRYKPPQAIEFDKYKRDYTRLEALQILRLIARESKIPILGSLTI